MSAFAINFFGTIARWRERHIYVAIWFWIATVVTIAMLHVFKDLVVPAGLFKSTRSDETGRGLGPDDNRTGSLGARRRQVGAPTQGRPIA